MVLLKCTDRLHVLKVEGIALDVLELAVVFEVHPGGMALRDVDCFLRHVFEIKDAWLYDLLLGLHQVMLLVICRCWVVVLDPGAAIGGIQLAE